MLLSLTLQAVIQLNQIEFEQKNEPIFVKFFAPWCGHCKALAPKWIELSQKLEQENSPITIAEVDCTLDRSLCADQKVNGFPTLIFYFDGRSYSYNGERTVEAMHDWLVRMQGPALNLYKSEEEIKQTARKFGEMTYYILHTDNMEAYEKYFTDYKGTHFIGAIKGSPSLEVIKNGVRRAFKGSLASKKDIGDFMLKNTVEPFTDLSHGNYGTFIRSGLTMFLCSGENQTEKHSQDLKKLSVLDKLHSNLGFLQITEKSTGFIKYHNGKVGRPNLFGGISVNNHGQIFTKIIRYGAYDPQKPLEEQLKDFEKKLLQTKAKYESLIEQGKPLEGFFDSPQVKEIMQMVQYNRMVQGLIALFIVTILFLVYALACYNPKPLPKKKTEESHKNAKEQTDKKKQD